MLIINSTTDNGFLFLPSELCKQEVVIYTVLNQPFSMLKSGVKDFKHKNCMVCPVSKGAKKLKYILAYILFHAFYAPAPLKYCLFLISPFILWTLLTLNTYTTQQLKDTCFFNSLYGILILLVMKGLIRYVHGYTQVL